MKPFDPSSLWRASDFREARNEGRLDLADASRHTVLPTTLLAELRRLESEGSEGDVLEVLAACLCNREAALLYLEHTEYVWPVTVFPREGLYHSPRAVQSISTRLAFSGLRVLSVEPPGVRPPGDAMHERVARPEKYHRLEALVWGLALHGPRPTLLRQIGGHAAYRVAAAHDPNVLPIHGATRSVVLRLQREAAPLAEISRWPGMTEERASRTLNGLYLCGALMISRTHPAATTPLSWLDLLARRR